MRIVLVLAMLFSVAGCQFNQNGGGPVTEIDYDKLAKRYNRRVGRVRQFWAYAVVAIDYVDDNGKAQHEQGEGQLRFRRPLDVALSIGKVGSMFFWIGGDAQRYWWFELNTDPKKGYVGRHDEQTEPGGQAGPLPVGPNELVGLLGLLAMPAGEEARPKLIAYKEGDASKVWWVTPLSDAKNGPSRHTLIDIKTARPIEVKLVDAKGEVIVKSQLSEYDLMKRDGAPKGAWPSLPK